MTDEQKPKPEKQLDELELNKETLQDLAEGEAEQAQGGLVYGAPQVSVGSHCFCTSAGGAC